MFVMAPLALATVVLWYCLGLRWHNLQRGNRRSARVIVQRYRAGDRRQPRGLIDTAVVWGLTLQHKYADRDLRPILDDAYAEFDGELRSGRTIIDCIVAVAPLAGLLGTVVG